MKEGHDTQNACSILLAIAAAVLYAFYLAWKAYNRTPERMIGDIHILDR